MLHPIAVKPEVWSLVGMDLVGPLKKTRKENKFILTMTCYFSKWVEYLIYRERYYNLERYIIKGTCICM